MRNSRNNTAMWFEEDLPYYMKAESESLGKDNLDEYDHAMKSGAWKAYNSLVEQGLIEVKPVQTSARELTPVEKQFEEKLLSNTVDMPPEFSKIVDNHFWEIL